MSNHINAFIEWSQYEKVDGKCTFKFTPLPMDIQNSIHNISLILTKILLYKNVMFIEEGKLFNFKHFVY